MKKVMMALAATALLFGCGEKEAAKPAKPAVPKSELTFEKMATNDVIIVVNGKELTKGMVEREIAVQAELMKIGKPNAKIGDLDRAKAKIIRTAEKRFIERRVMVDEAERRGFKVTDEDRQNIRERLAKSVLRGSKAKYGILAGKLDAVSRAELDEGLDLDALCQKVNLALMEECRVHVTDAEAQAKFRELEEYNKGAKEEEARIWKNASNAWERIQSGESFERAAERCTAASEHVNSDLEWGDFELAFFKDDVQICRYLPIMSAGTVTPPLPGDNGLLIIKMIKKTPADLGAGQTEPRYRLAKIFFELPETYPLTTAAALKPEMVSALSEKAFKTRVAELVAAAKVEYPNGKVMPEPAQANGLKRVGKKAAPKQN